jgi:hypothetical protein
MPETPQAVELAQLVELEALWENLPHASTNSTRELIAKQSAYEAYRSRRAAYAALYKVAYDPRALAHTPARLGAWLRAMRDLFARAEADPRCPCPVHLLERARRCAERTAQRLKMEPPAPPPPALTVRAAIEGLEALARWCEGAEAA